MTYISYVPCHPLNAYVEDLYYLDGPAAYPRLLDVTQPMNLTLIAHESQFYDQPHFNKDFVVFTGYSRLGNERSCKHAEARYDTLPRNRLHLRK